LVDNLLLVVDDDYDIASLIKIGLEKNGLSVSPFTDPTLALEEFSKKSSDYELVISDIRMPEMNGHEFVKQVKMDNQKQELIRHHGKALEIKRVDNSYILVIQNGSTKFK
jgi:CheY-like chemotaxis protein